MDIILKLLAVLALVAANGLFVAAEFSIIAAKRVRVEHLAVEGSVLARLARTTMDDPNRLISSAQLGITMTSLALGWIGVSTMAPIVEPVFALLVPEPFVGISSHGISIVVAYILLTILHIVLGEQVPKMISLARPEHTVLVSAHPTQFMGFIFRPFIFLIHKATDLVLSIIGIPKQRDHHLVYSVEEFEQMIEASHEAGVLEEQEEEMLHGVFGFADHLARELMIPRPDIVGVPADDSVADFLEIYRESPRARFPAYQDSLDDIVGILSIKDLLMAMAEGRVSQDTPIREILRPAYFVPETKRIGELFNELQSRNIQMAVVVDEYGGTAGIITIEQMVEEIVGEFADEFEVHELPIRRIDASTVEVDAGMRIDEIKDELDLELPSGDYETLAGFVLDRLGHIPQVGEQFVYENLQFEVAAVDGVKVETVRIVALDNRPIGEQATDVGQLP